MSNFDLSRTLVENINDQNDKINNCIDIVNGLANDEEIKVIQELRINEELRQQNELVRQQNELIRQEQYHNNENRFNGINEQLETNASKLNYNIISVPKFDSIENKFILGEKISADSRILNFDSLITNYYDSLLSNNSTYVSKSTLGLDSSGKYNIYKYTFKPNSPRYKVLLISGVHGAENVYPHTLFNFFEFLCNTENLYDYPYFQEIYENFEFVVIPILNPHGWNGNYRTNGNNVDINRNFDYNWELNASSEKGSAPFSEVESQYIRDLLKSYNPDLFLDLHNSLELAQDFYCAYDSGKLNANIFRQLLKALDKKKKVEFGYSNGTLLSGMADSPVSQAYANKVLQIQSATVEWVNSYTGANDKSKWYNSTHMTKSMELLVNVLYRHLLLLKEHYLDKNNLVQINYSSGNNLFVENSEDFVKLEQYEYNFYAKYDCVATFNGGIVLTNESINNVSAICVINTTGTINNNEKYTNEVYSNFKGTFALPLFASFLIKKGETIKLNFYVKSSNGKAIVKRIRGNFEVKLNTDRNMKTISLT